MISKAGEGGGGGGGGQDTLCPPPPPLDLHTYVYLKLWEFFSRDSKGRWVILKQDKCVQAFEALLYFKVLLNKHNFAAFHWTRGSKFLPKLASFSQLCVCEQLRLV